MSTILIVALWGCGNETGTLAIPRRLESFPYVDAGAVAPEDRRSFIVPLFSTGSTKLTIYDMQVLDDATGAPSEVFQLDDAWKTYDTDRDGTPDGTQLEKYDPASDDDTLALPVVFAPPAEGFYSAVMTIWSDDNETSESAPLPDDSGRELGIWKVELRGVAQNPCARVIPSFVDFGLRPSGGQFTSTLQIENCGLVTIDVAQATFTGTIQGSVESGTLYPLYILPGSSEMVDLRYTASATSVSGKLNFVSNANALDLIDVNIVGNDCPDSMDKAWDHDLDGWTTCGGDCNDNDYSVSPSSVERAGNGGDDDCDGETDEAPNIVGTDDDGDGYSEIDGDCDDADMAISPVVTEIPNNIDDNCDGKIDNNTDRNDDDADGHSEREGDCDDTSVLVDVDVPETPDGVDNDCDGQVDEGGPDFDDDRDGYTDNDGDCDDGDPWAYPGAFEFCDYYDNDCDTNIDEGEDDAEQGACAFLPERHAAQN